MVEENKNSKEDKKPVEKKGFFGKMKASLDKRAARYEVNQANETGAEKLEKLKAVNIWGAGSTALLAVGIAGAAFSSGILFVGMAALAVYGAAETLMALSGRNMIKKEIARLEPAGTRGLKAHLVENETVQTRGNSRGNLKLTLPTVKNAAIEAAYIQETTSGNTEAPHVQHMSKTVEGKMAPISFSKKTFIDITKKGQGM